MEPRENILETLRAHLGLEDLNHAVAISGIRVHQFVVDAIKADDSLESVNTLRRQTIKKREKPPPAIPGNMVFFHSPKKHGRNRKASRRLAPSVDDLSKMPIQEKESARSGPDQEPRTSGHPAVFFDRDGTLIEDRGHLRDPGEVVFFADTVDALRRLQAHARLFIVTHQSGIGMGLLTQADADRVNTFVVDRLREAGVIITAVYCCPHRHDEGCACIKPNPLFLKQAASEYGLDLRRSFVVGDHPHDVELAGNAAATGIYVLTGHGAKHRAELPPGAIVVPGIREAADWILASVRMHDQEHKQPGLLDTAAGILRNGGVVAFPTETVYGLGAVVFNEKAVARVFEVKARPRFDPLIVHVSGLEHIPLLTTQVPAAAQALMERFWPGPLTVVLPKSPQVPDLVTAGLPTVALRMPRHPFALELIRRTGAPLAAPSANPFGHTSPTTAQHVLDHLAGKVDLVLDGGSCSVGIESTVVSFTCDTPTLLRPGGLPVEEIEALIGPLARPPAKGEPIVVAPGMLPRHYAPRTPVKVVCNIKNYTPNLKGRVGLLTLKKMEDTAPFAAAEFLSANGDLREAASNLFGALRKLDAQGLELIIAELVPNIGLGLAINDRLLRAAGTGAPETGNVSAGHAATRENMV